MFKTFPCTSLTDLEQRFNSYTCQTTHPTDRTQTHCVLVSLQLKWSDSYSTVYKPGFDPDLWRTDLFYVLYALLIPGHKMSSAKVLVWIRATFWKLEVTGQCFHIQYVVMLCLFCIAGTRLEPKHNYNLIDVLARWGIRTVAPGLVSLATYMGCAGWVNQNPKALLLVNQDSVLSWFYDGKDHWMGAIIVYLPLMLWKRKFTIYLKKTFLIICHSLFSWDEIYTIYINNTVKSSQNPLN